MTQAFEVNFDGIVGSTHNYSGLSLGNVASTSHQSLESNPLEAVLQGLQKMKALADLGFIQGVLPPQERPDLHTLRRLGFNGGEKRILQEVRRYPDLLAAVTSASSMWTANAATVSPSADSADHKVHFTPANLITKFHRSIEVSTTAGALKKIFKNPKYFVHHEPLPPVAAFGDEGAANHTRLCGDYSKQGVQFFVYGRHGLRATGAHPKRFPARQTYEACATLVRTHMLDEGATVLAQQNPDAIDAGVFHNDVAGVGNQNVYFYHELAYLNSKEVIEEIRRKFQNTCKSDIHLISVPDIEVGLDDAVNSYLFNSQLLTLSEGHMILIAPLECQENSAVAKYLRKLLEDKSHPIKEVSHFNLRQSMQNGGGPACLRLRVVLTKKELEAVNPKALMNAKLYDRLVRWAKKHYRDRLKLEDLADPSLLKENRSGLDELTQILGLGSLYQFQK